MAGNKVSARKKSSSRTPGLVKSTALGRRRDESLDTHIVEAAIEVLAAVGFDSMTMDMVASRAKAGKASLYRRWSSKAELVRDALLWMSEGSVELDTIPDTGSLRDDLFALQKPYSAEHSNRKSKVLSGLGSFLSEHRAIADEVMTGIYDPLIKLHHLLMERAIERREIPEHADIEMASQVIIATIAYRTREQNRSFEKADYAKLLDHLVIPALKHPPSRSGKR